MLASFSPINHKSFKKWLSMSIMMGLVINFQIFIIWKTRFRIIYFKNGVFPISTTIWFSQKKMKMLWFAWINCRCLMIVIVVVKLWLIFVRDLQKDMMFRKFLVQKYVFLFFYLFIFLKNFPNFSSHFFVFFW